ncbi:MAG: hypothetical protein ACKOQP_04180, partial [Bacteroidota bacterium]
MKLFLSTTKTVFFLLLFLLGCCRVSVSWAQTQHSATWTDGVACIVYSHCTPCHNNQGIGPFPLTTYNEVYANRYSIAASVQARSMPPFP